MGQVNLSSTFLKSCNASQAYVQCDKVLDLSDYKNTYFQTAEEYIYKMLVSLDQLTTDILNREALNNLHISSHSLKSQSQMMGFTEVSDICLNIETVSDNALKGNTQLNVQIISDFKKLTEKLREILKQVQDNTA